MSRPENPCLSIAISRLKTAAANHFACWVLQAPYPGGFVHHDCIWPQELSLVWQAWLEMFSPKSLPLETPAAITSPELLIPTATDAASPHQPLSYSSRLMQHCGISLWEWLFEGPIQGSLHESKGIATGQKQPLRLRLDIREPDLIALPWEIMQPKPGQPAISLNPQMLFSRTTNDVDPLPRQKTTQSLNILLVLGQNMESATETMAKPLVSLTEPQTLELKLEQEAAELKKVLESCGKLDEPQNSTDTRSTCRVDTLIQPTPAELIAALETETYNVLFYGGHGIPAPDGGLLLLRSDTTLNGTELAQVLVRCGIKLAVFNACWGAQPAIEQVKGESQVMPRSSLAEVLIHHGVPAVLGMRDSITDQEALSFIQAFAQALAERMSIDQAVAVARQQLLTLYKFNQPAWTLPVLYMHPQFNGELIQSLDEIRTELPTNSRTWIGHITLNACLRSLGENGQEWSIRTGMVRVGRLPGNDVMVQEAWVSQKHAEIFCRNAVPEVAAEPTYFLRDFSRYGTLVLGTAGWQRVHHQEVALQSGTQLKFGSSQGQTFEFLIEMPTHLNQLEENCGTS